MTILAKLEAKVAEWNSRCGVGTKVVVRKDDDSEVETATRSKAEVLSGHSAVIWLDGIRGCYLLDRVNAAAARGRKA